MNCILRVFYSCARPARYSMFVMLRTGVARFPNDKVSPPPTARSMAESVPKRNTPMADRAPDRTDREVNAISRAGFLRNTRRLRTSIFPPHATGKVDFLAAFAIWTQTAIDDTSRSVPDRSVTSYIGGWKSPLDIQVRDLHWSKCFEHDYCQRTSYCERAVSHFHT